MKENGRKNNSELDPADDFSWERKTYITADFEMQLLFPHFASVAGSLCSLFNYMATVTNAAEISRMTPFLSRRIVFQDPFKDLKPLQVALLIRAGDIWWYHIQEPAVT